MTRLQEAALAFAEAGWHILPLCPRGKTPIPAHGLHDAARGVGTVRTGWDRTPDANIGLACGGSGVVAIDVDAGRGGLESWAAIDPGVPTWISCTGGGGRHYFYRAPDGVEIRNSVDKLGPGIDGRGAGGYILLPPSIHPNGTPYTWLERRSLACPDQAGSVRPSWLRLTCHTRSCKASSWGLAARWTGWSGHGLCRSVGGNGLLGQGLAELTAHFEHAGLQLGPVRTYGGVCPIQHSVDQLLGLRHQLGFALGAGRFSLRGLHRALLQKGDGPLSHISPLV